jgi:hypothetical protein
MLESAGADESVLAVFREHLAAYESGRAVRDD